MLVMAVCGAMREHFSNGQAKTLTYELVRLVMTHGMCDAS